MSNLITLHVAGNRITGTLPGEGEFISKNITSINMAYNILEGTLSNAFLNGTFLEFDINSNRITGLLDFQGRVLDGSSGSSIFKTRINRLSGVVPSASINEFSVVDVLTGNLIQCGFWLPADPTNGSYR